MPHGPLRDNYENGKIYKLVGTGTTSIYIGSTCKTLNHRLWHHNHTNKNSKQRQSTAAQLYQQSPCASIELIEDYPCTTKEMLLARERYWIEKLKAEGVRVVNCQVPRALLTEDEMRSRRNEIRRNATSKLYQCPCGSIIRLVQKEEHLATKLHANKLKRLEDDASGNTIQLV